MPRRARASPNPVDNWLPDDACLVPAQSLLAHKPTTAADAERYCLTLYHQMDVPDRGQDEFDALWARSAEFDPERRLLKAIYDLSLLDVWYDALRHGNVFWRVVQPRPQLAQLIASSRCLRAYYADSDRKSRAIVLAPPLELAKDFVRNLIMSLFLLVTLGAPCPFDVALLSMPKSGRLFVQVGVAAFVFSVLVAILRRLLRLPSAPTLLATDAYSWGILRSGPWTFLRRSLIADLVDECSYRWLSISALAFLLSLFNMAITHYVGSIALIMALVVVVGERCSLRSILIVAGLAAAMIYVQVFDNMLLWRLGSVLASTTDSILSWLWLASPELDTTQYLPDFLLALMLSPIRLHPALTLTPWTYADLFLTPCQILFSALFWKITLSAGFMSALIARLVFSAVSGLLCIWLQGPLVSEFVAKAHQE